MIATGADGAADALTKRYAKRGTAGPAGTYAVTFTGINSSDDYMRLAGYLDNLQIIRKITPQRATPEQVTLSLELATGLAGFKRMAARDGVIVATEGDMPVYQLR